MKNLFDSMESIWLIDVIDYVGIQKINRLPDCESLRQVGRMCIAMGMDKIQMKPACVTIGGIQVNGCVITCKGFDIVPFVTGIYPDKELSSTELDLESVYSKIGNNDDETYN